MHKGLPSLKNEKAKRVWFITDTHLGVRNSSNEWIDIIDSYFHDFFFPLIKEQYHAKLNSLISLGSKFVLFGAGHQSITFINSLQLSSFIAYVVDDDPNKVDCLIPGTKIQIQNSEFFLNDTSVTHCLLGVSPAVEERIKIKISSFLERGGALFSIFVGGFSDNLVSK